MYLSHLDLMSSDVWVVNTLIIGWFGLKVKADSNFDYFLNSVAKTRCFGTTVCSTDWLGCSGETREHYYHPLETNLFYYFVL
jgi:hypothetical protein